MIHLNYSMNWPCCYNHTNSIFIYLFIHICSDQMLIINIALIYDDVWVPKWQIIIKHKPYHSWQLLVFRNLADFVKSGRFHEILRHSLPTALHKTEEFFLNYLIYKVCKWISWNPSDFMWNLLDFMWNPPDFMKSTEFHEYELLRDRQV